MQLKDEPDAEVARKLRKMVDPGESELSMSYLGCAIAVLRAYLER